MERTITVRDEHGLHARPASVFVAAATKFKSTMTVEVNGKTANGKSLLHLLALGITKGQTIKITTTGEDENEALHQVCAILENNGINA